MNGKILIDHSFLPLDGEDKGEGGNA